MPWPWTLNVELKPYYFSNKQEAKTALRQFLATDNKRIAVGIGQIYLPSHGHLFSDPTVLLEPEINLHYAAKLLADNFQWTIEQGIRVVDSRGPLPHTIAPRFSDSVQ